MSQQLMDKSASSSSQPIRSANTNHDYDFLYDEDAANS